MHTKKPTRQRNRRTNPVAVKKVKAFACDILVLAFIALVILGLAGGAEAGILV